MSKENKIKKLKKSQNSSYRLAVMKEDSYQEKFALSLSKRNIFLITFSITFFIILITSLIIFYTPIREYIPGYDTSKIRSQAINNLEKIDSLMISLQKNEQFMESFSNTLQGKSFDNKYVISLIIIFSVYAEFYKIEFLIILHRNPGESV